MPRRKAQRVEQRPMGLAFKGPLVVLALIAVVLVLVLAYAGNGYVVGNAQPSSAPHASAGMAH